MRYLSLTGFVVTAAAIAAFACEDGDSLKPPGPNVAGEAGEAGAQPEAGSGGTAANAGKGGTGDAGKGGTGNAGKGGTGNAGNPAGGDAGNGGEAGGSGGNTGGTGGTTGGNGGIGGIGGSGVIGGNGGIGGSGGNGGSGGEVLPAKSLSVTVSGVPTGAPASVTINGPDSYVKTISTSTTLLDLTPGSYTISAPPIRVPGTQVDSVFDATVNGSPAEVVLAAGSTATVNYAKRAGTGMMWATNYSGRNVFGFDAAAIAKTGTQSDAPGVALTLLNVGTNNPPTPTIAFSAKGELWVGTCRNAQVPQVLAKFSPAKLAGSGSPNADVTLTLPATDGTYDCADALAFDAAGNLWVGMNHGHILRFNASDLATSGTPAPAVNLTSPTYFNGVLDIAFDSSGNLFVASYSTRIISRVDASQLLTSDPAIVPAVRLALAAGSGPGGLAVGGDGSLWISDYNHSTVIKLNAADLGTNGTPTPALTLTNIPGPEQLAFDNAGNLWVASYDSSTIIALSAADITTGGAKTPLTTLDGGASLTTTFGLRFNPGAP